MKPTRTALRRFLRGASRGVLQLAEAHVELGNLCCLDESDGDDGNDGGGNPLPSDLQYRQALRHLDAARALQPTPALDELRAEVYSLVHGGGTSSSDEGRVSDEDADD